MVDRAFNRLMRRQQDGVDPGRLVEVTSVLLRDIFRKSDPAFWFNRIYHQYKTQAKPESDFQVLVLIDFFANAIAQGIPEMNMPFEFKTVTGWKQVLLQNGFKVNRTVVAGFEPGLMHKSCHVGLVCERTGSPDKGYG